MTMEFRPMGKPHCFDLLEGEEKIGELLYTPPEEEGDDPFWDVSLWSETGSGKTWSADTAESHEQAAAHARELYEEYRAERRKLNSPSPGPRTSVVSTPMGGQRRR